MYQVPMLFPGQASQVVGMARDLAERPGPAADFLAQVDATLDHPLTEIMFDGPLETLTETHNAQPAILAHSVAVTLALAELGVRPNVVAGHSLGEYSAAVAAGALTPAAALCLVRRRGELMFAAGEERPGAMAAVLGLTSEVVTQVCADITEQVGVVCLANHNSDNQVVISGEVAAVAAATEPLKAAGAKRVIQLQVSGAFHSPLLEHAAARFATEIDLALLLDAQVPLIANVSARPLTAAKKLQDGLTRQLTSPVLWHHTMQHIAAGESTATVPRLVLEVGPGRVLTNLAKRVYPEIKFVPVGNCQDLDNILVSLQEHLT
ncbi:MAG: ACP S-malonyltransferase [bacterium]